MQPDRDQNRQDQKETGQSSKEETKKQRSSAFRENSRGDEKSTTNIEEEAKLEQERKDAMTERD